MTEIDRRRFLHLAAASAALGGIAGCGPEAPPGRIVPYVKAPDGVVPGRPNFYATATTLGGYATGVLVRHDMGRPLKVEGNPDHPDSLGGTDVWGQAAVLSLYDPDRSQAVLADGRIADWDAVAAMLAERRGTRLRILTGAVTSPTLAAQLARLQQALPAMRWHQWEAVGREAVAAGAALAFGRPLDALYHLDRADVVLAVDSDLLSSAPGHLRHARAFAARRRPAEVGARMSRLYALDCTPTLTGAMADHRRLLTPPELYTALRQLAARLGAGPADWGSGAPAWLGAWADDLAAHRGAALVHVGPGQPAALHALAHLLNGVLGAFGRTVTLIEPVAATAPGGLADLVADMAAGRVDTLLVLQANPAFTAPADLGFAAALARVPVTLHLGEERDETAAACRWHVPAAHVFEAWSDARASDGSITVLQPQVRPFYGGKSAHELLAVLGGDLAPDGLALVRARWAAHAADSADPAWTEAVGRGVVPGSQAAPVTAPLRDVGLPEPAPTAGLTLLFRPDEALWDGRFANNGWLQELPRAHSKLVWDNAALVAPATAARLGLANGDVVRLTAGGRSLEIPAWVQPGQAPDCVTLPLGFGRRVVGGVGAGTGFDTYALRGASGLWQQDGAVLARTGRRHALATSQLEPGMEGTDLVRTAALATFLADPGFLGARDADRSLYPPHPYGGEAWAMSISLNSCIGCNACIVACVAENNIAVVGKDQVMRGRLMHWLRIDRYDSGAPDDPDVQFQPVPCMHCEDAPCEVVCPVQATLHDSDGLNLMVYNRCIGTRFCSNNCPYKVRRFNFFGFAADDPRLAEAWNPDVSVRGRGVMEKCTYCVQRIRQAKIAADRDDRAITDGEVVTACQQACPTQAIVFGNRNDRASAVFRRKASPLDYVLLPELNTRPRTSYEAHLRNRNDRAEG